MNRLQVIFFLLFLSFYSFSYGQIKLPKLISDGMILQRDTKIKLWGWATPGEKVTVSFDGKQYAATAGNNSKWMLQLSPQHAGGPYDIVLTGNNSITIKNVLFGDV